MTKEEIKLKEKLYPFQLGIIKNSLHSGDLSIQLRENQLKYIEDSHKLILQSLSKIVKSSNCFISFDASQTKVHLYKESELISTISYSQFPTRFTQDNPPLPILKIQNFISSNNDILKTEEINKLKIWERVNNNLLKNESKIVQKVNILFKKHQKLGFKLIKQLKNINTRLNKFQIKKSTLFLPYFLKDIKNGIFFPDVYHPEIKFPDGSSYMISQIKLTSNNTFLATLSYQKDNTKSGLTLHIKVDDPKKYIKYYLLPEIGDDILFPPLYNQIKKEVENTIRDNNIF